MIAAELLTIDQPTFAGRIYDREAVERIVAGFEGGKNLVVFDDDVRSVTVDLTNAAGLVERMEIVGGVLYAHYRPLETERGVELAALAKCGFPILYTPVCVGKVNAQNRVSDIEYHFLNAYQGYKPD